MALPSLYNYVSASDQLAPALLGAAAGSVALLTLTGLVAFGLRRASAAARHATWLLGFIALLLLPILSAALPKWYVLPLPRAAPAQASRAIPPTAASPIPSPTASALEPASNDHPDTSANTQSQKGTTAVPPSLVIAPSSVNPATPETAVPRSAATPTARRTPLPWTAWLLPCWALGTLLILTRVLLGHLALRALQSRSTTITRGELVDHLEHLRTQLYISRPVQLLTDPTQTMPMTWGLSRARLLLPADAAAWPADHRRDVLLHELGHVKRRDCLTQLLAQLACALYWFNPLAWLASRRMQVERERACDDLVLNHGAQPSAYAQHVLASVTSAPALRLAGTAIAMARPTTLEERMTAILNTRLNRRGLAPRTTLATILLLLPALIPAAILRAQQAPPPPAPPQVAPAPGAATSPTTRRVYRGGAPDSPTSRPASMSPRPGFERGYSGPAAPTPGEGPTCTLDATVYDVRIPVDQIGKLDVDALSKSSDTADAFEKALATLGATKPMYRTTQSVRIAGDTITIGSEVPLVTNTRVTDKGQSINTVQYTSTGARFTIAAKPGATDIDLNVQVTTVADVGAQVSDKVNAPIMRRTTLNHKGPFQPRKPFLLVSVDADSPDKDGKAVAYIARITLGDPQPPAPK